MSLREDIEELILDYRRRTVRGRSGYYGSDSESAAYYDGQEAGEISAYENVVEDLERVLSQLGE